MTRHESGSNRLTRRQQIGGTGAVLLGFSAGCLGGDEDPDDIDNADLADDADDVDGPSDDADVTEDYELHDVKAHWMYHGDLPLDAQHNFYAEGGGISDNAWSLTRNYEMVVQSVYDMEIHGLQVEDWTYEPGVLEFTFHDDFYWWSGDRVEADDYLMQLEFEDFYWGGDDFDLHESIVSAERVDDLTVRLALGDSWHEAWAFEETILDTNLGHSRTYYEPWLEEFEDAPDLDAVEDIRADIENDQITDDEMLVHTNNSLYEFRYDGSIGGVEEEHYDLELVPEKNGNVRHFANPDNHDHLPDVKYHRLELRAHRDERHGPEQELFRQQEIPVAEGIEFPDVVVEAQEGELPFETEILQYRARTDDEGGISFNHLTPPSDDPRFRRAIAYLTDNTTWEMNPESFPVEYYHPYLSDEELYDWTSEEVIDAFTDYHYDEVAVDEAEAELEAGGYERDADGNWLFKEDGEEGEAGEPMDFDVYTHEWMRYVPDLGSDWIADLEDFGISTTWFAEWHDDGDWTFFYGYTGGVRPDYAFNAIFREELGWEWSRRVYEVPSTILAPPFLETAEAGASMDDWEVYDVGAMTDRLPVTTDEDTHQDLSDQLAWVVNQTVNHFSTATPIRHQVTNAERWHWPAIEDAPERWRDEVTRVGARVLQYAGED